jgi:hypothetical protein
MHRPQYPRDWISLPPRAQEEIQPPHPIFVGEGGSTRKAGPKYQGDSIMKTTTFSLATAVSLALSVGSFAHAQHYSQVNLVPTHLV